MTLCTSPPTAPAEEVLTLGLELGEADRVIPTADEETVMVGTIPPVTTWDERVGSSTTKGAEYSSSMSNRAGMSPKLGIMDIERGVVEDCDMKGYPLRIGGRKGCPVMGSKLYPMFACHMGKL